ncbi:MAG: c-type cytochrome, partial [Vicinamibacteria bacterium]
RYVWINVDRGETTNLMSGTCRRIHRLGLAWLLTLAHPHVGSAQDAEPNKTAYDLHCALCHGEDGTAVETLEKLAGVEIPHLGSSHVQDQSDDQIRKVILKGKGKMNPVQTIAEDEIAGVIAFLRTLAED